MKETLIYHGKRSRVFKRSLDSGEVQAVKVLSTSTPTIADIAKFHSEFDLLQGRDLPGVRRTLSKGRENNQPVIIMEWLDLSPLDDIISEQNCTLRDAVNLALNIAEILRQVHDVGIVHCDINPKNILVDVQQGEAKLIDFGIAKNFSLKQRYQSNLNDVEGTAAYMSPEQTGRMNRTVDFRSDLYSLGVTLYQLVSGHLPFEDNGDVVELVHAHLTKKPRSLGGPDSDVPEMVSRIIQRLLEKDVSKRYQTARGVKHDLQKCHEALSASQSEIVLFELGQKDISQRFSLPQKLYGRDKEIETIVSVFDQCADNDKRLVLVGGYSGVGKTNLVYEVHKPITATRGNFCSGKFDQFQKETPYSAILTAFEELIDAALMQSDSQLENLKEKLSFALGEEGQVLTNVLPTLEQIIGVQPDVASLEGAEAKIRFNYVFLKFAAVFCSADTPVVLFIDDLQWADSSSLDLIQSIMTDSQLRNLLVICAFRSNEVSATHPFILMVDELEDNGIAPNKIELGNLSQENLNALLSDALKLPLEGTSQLAGLVHNKTNGNAFFATEFLKVLADEDLLYFDPLKTTWTCDFSAIVAKDITDNVVDLMSAKVEKLASATQQALKFAACVGASFEVSTLAQISESNAEQVLSDLNVALVQGLILPTGESQFKFSHDRIQQAVYSLISDAEKIELHYAIGTRLKNKVLAGNTDNYDLLGPALFDIVNHLNLGASLLNGEASQLELAKLNFAAGRKAKQNSAFPTALGYLDKGIDLLPQNNNPWTTHYELTYDLYSDGCEAAYLTGDFDVMEQRFQVVVANADSMLATVKPYQTRILALKAQNKLMDAIDTGLEVLEKLGETFPKKPSMMHVMAGLIQTTVSLRGKSNDDILEQPIMSDPIKSAVMNIIANITSSIYWGRPTLFPLVVFRMMRLSLLYGNHPVSSFSYGTYGVIQTGLLGQMRTGYRFSELALQILDKLDAKEWRAQVSCIPYSLVNHWNEHVRDSFRPLQQSFHIAMETGDVEFACVNTNLYCIQAYLAGLPLAQMENEIASYSQIYGQLNQETNQNYNEVFRQAILNLMGRSENQIRLVGEAFNEEIVAETNVANSDRTGQFFIHFNKTILSYLFGDIQQAVEQSKIAATYLDSVLAKFEIPNLKFYQALILIKSAETKPAFQRAKMLMQARKNMGQLKTWAKTAPQNYQHKHDLCLAELRRVQGRPQAARLAYDRAIAGAIKYEFVHEQAMAFELAGAFYLRQDQMILAEFHLRAASNAYREWGALAKLDQLSRLYPKIINSSSDGSGETLVAGGSTATTLTTSTSTSNVGASLDISSLTKAAISISGEVQPAKLHSTLLKIVLESAGAQRGILILADQNELRVKAVGGDGGQKIDVMQDMPIVDFSDKMVVPLVNYVYRTGSEVIIADAQTDDRVSGDAYQSLSNLKSIMCVPIKNRGRTSGVIYLENGLTTNAFTPSRVKLLSLLSGQIAVSIDNATMYEQLETKVKDRTKDLKREQERADDLILNILPKKTAIELKETGTSAAKYYKRVTVLFTDFVGFTELSSRLEPEQLVQQLNDCFSAFDKITAKYQVEKIKTAGDAYIAAGGLPVENSTHYMDVLNAAHEMREFIADYNATIGEDRRLDIRIGVSTGPVVAGIVGTKKFQYDLWGDTVNIAARMESSCPADCINVSEATYELTKDRFNYQPVREVAVKGKGVMKMHAIP